MHPGVAVEGKRVNLVDFAKCRIWVGEPVDLLTAADIEPVIENGVAVWQPVYLQNTGKWQIGFEWEEPREVKEIILKFKDETALPCKNDIKIQYWNRHWPVELPENRPGAGRGWLEKEDPWQGNWRTAIININADSLSFHITFAPLDWVEMPEKSKIEDTVGYNVAYRRTLKLKIIFEGGNEPALTGIEINSGSTFQRSRCHIFFENPALSITGQLSAYNGFLRPIECPAAEFTQKSIDFTKPTGDNLTFDYLYTSAGKNSGERTVLTLATQAYTVSFLACDIPYGPVWIKDYGIVITQAADTEGYASITGRINTGLTCIYDLVEAEDEQSYERVSREMPPLDKIKANDTWDGKGRYVPLTCDGTRKEFYIRYNGEIFSDKEKIRASGKDLMNVLWPGKEIRYRFGTGDPADFREDRDVTRQSLLEEHLPIVISQWTDREIEFTQTAFACFLEGAFTSYSLIKGDEEIAVLVRIKIRNTTIGRKKADLWIGVSPAERLITRDGNVFAAGKVIPGLQVKRQWKVKPYDELRLRFYFNENGRGGCMTLPLADPAHTIPTAFLYSLELDGLEEHTVYAALPFDTYRDIPGIDMIRRLSCPETFDRQLKETSAYWEDYINSGASVQTPDLILNDLFKTVPVHIAQTADRDAGSGLYVLPAATAIYGACGNEACFQIRLLDMLGHHKRAEMYLDVFLRTQGRTKMGGLFSSFEGLFLAVDPAPGVDAISNFGYNLDHGFIMRCLADHYRFTGDADWLKGISENLVKACEFIIRERRNNCVFEVSGGRAACYGLLPPGRLEDNGDWRFWFAVNAHAHKGLKEVAGVLKDINHPEAERLACEAAEYRQDIRKAALRAMEECPVVRLRDGTWIPHIPPRAGLRGRDWGWITEAAYCGLHLLDGDIFEPGDREVTWILKDLEDNIYMSHEFGRAVDVDRRWFSQGGVTIQPNLLNNNMAYLRRGEVKHAIRALYNNLGLSLYPDLKHFVEHPVIELGHGWGPFYKTPDESAFLAALRNFLVREDGERLLIGSGLPKAWLKPGKRIVVQNAATFFGPVSFSLHSDIVNNTIIIGLNPPLRNTPGEIVLRVPHPDDLKIRAAEVTGSKGCTLDISGELIILKSVRENVRLKVSYSAG
ncbi:MAG: hypothetical protein AB1798_14850 [Spirochaetota bacterium]